MRNNGDLSDAELRLIRAILAGHTTGQALRVELCIAHGTVAAHLESIYRKTGAFNKTDIVLMVLGVKTCQLDIVAQLAGPAPKRAKRRNGRATATK